ncbi:MAG: DUF2062 domain-containing protein [Pseudomonadota bacterium]
MPKKLFRRIAPHPDTLRGNKLFERFAHLLHDPNLWHFNRHSVARAFGAGMFAAFLPFPFQSPIAAALAIWLRANLPLAVLMVFLTNPFTMVPIELSAYWLGNLIVQSELRTLPESFEWSWVWDNLSSIGMPLVLGHFMLSILTAVIGYYGIHGFWRLHIALHLRKRKKRIYEPGLPQAGIRTVPIRPDEPPVGD